jgi:hypothetical protein
MKRLSDWLRLWDDKQQEQTYTYTKDNLTFTKDNQGKTISVEGYLKEQSGKRPQSEKTAQKEIQKETNLDKNGKSYYDASHIIAYE